METDWKSSSLRKMSIKSLRQVDKGESGVTFSEMGNDLSRMLRYVQKMDKGIATKEEKSYVWGFGRSWGGYDELFGPLRGGEYRKAMNVIKKELKEVKEHQNIARKKWGIATGVSAEITRRGK